MKTLIQLARRFVMALATLAGFVTVVRGQGTAFTYQGLLNLNGAAASGSYDLTFALYPTNITGSSIGGPVTNAAVSVSNGVFSTLVDLGPGTFLGGATNWLQIGVASNGTGNFFALSPRQEVTPTPYAIVAENLVGGTVLSNLTVVSPLVLSTTNLAYTVYAGNGTLMQYSDVAYNTFDGYATGNLTMIQNGAQDNTAVGGAAFRSNIGGSDNSAYGKFALFFNQNGNDNTGTGSQVLQYNQNGSQNTAVGALALFYLGFHGQTSSFGGGSNNIAIGWQAGYSFTNLESGNIDIGSAGVVNENYTIRLGTPGTHTNTVIAGVINGNAAGLTNFTLSQLPSAVLTNGETSAVTFDGTLTFPSTATINAGSGLFLRSDGNANFFAGSAGNLTASGGQNIGVGGGSLGNVTSGGDNTAIGSGPLNHTTTGRFNTAVGAGALFDSVVGSYNTAVGDQALLALGFANSAGGSNNVALGYLAGNNFTHNESGNIDIGNAGTVGENGVIRIGGSSQTNAYIAGIGGSTISGGSAVFVNTATGQLGIESSSKRFKRDIRAMGDTSDVLLALEPVTFCYNPNLDAAALPQFGLIAEQVEQVDPDLVVHDEEHGIYTVRYEAVNAMLLNEFLKEHRQVETLKRQLADETTTLQSENADLKARLERLEKLVVDHKRP